MLSSLKNMSENERNWSAEPIFQGINGVAVMRSKFLAEVYLKVGSESKDPSKSARFLLKGIRNLEEDFKETNYLKEERPLVLPEGVKI